MPIFDQGYQHWQGELSGHAWRWLTITSQGVRTGLRSRWVRLASLAALVPALSLAAFLLLWGLAEQRVNQGILQNIGLLPPGKTADPAASPIFVNGIPAAPATILGPAREQASAAASSS